MPRTLRSVGASWREVSGYIADFQARLIMTVFYFTMALPFGVLMRVTRGARRMRPGPGQSTWTARLPETVDLRAARRQY